MKRPKKVGELIEAIFQVQALQRGFIVSKPFGDSAKYDFVLDFEGKLSRVQVKTTNHLYKKTANAKGCFIVKTSRCSGKWRYKSKDVDFIAVYVTEKDTWYIIPVSAVCSRSIGLYPHVVGSKSKNEIYKESWDLLKPKAMNGSRPAQY